ncbi:MAG: 50S ribosomal protein L29 [Candidatus Kapabacteria bacterium]|nr:50S ribosomal protein L29 [Candidatus Kapabacteria bacterium]
MKARKAKDLRELNDMELNAAITEARETLAKQRFMHSMKQLQDTAYLRTLKKDIARMLTIQSERKLNTVTE